jgi:hypothetical protein
VVNEYYRRGQSRGKENRQAGGNVGNSVLLGLEKDHRNLVKHCLNMEEEIKNYTSEMGKYNEMKAHLLSVSHTSTKYSPLHVGNSSKNSDISLRRTASSRRKTTGWGSSWKRASRNASDSGRARSSGRRKRI